MTLTRRRRMPVLPDCPADRTARDTVAPMALFPTSLTPLNLQAEWPQVVRSADGARVVAAWSSTHDQGQVLQVATSQDGGATWSAPVNVATQAVLEAKVQLHQLVASA